MLDFKILWQVLEPKIKNALVLISFLLLLFIFSSCFAYISREYPEQVSFGAMIFGSGALLVIIVLSIYFGIKNIIKEYKQQKTKSKVK